MNMRRSIARLSVLLLLLSVWLPVKAEEPDWGLYQQLLDQHLSRHRSLGVELAWLDYSALKKDRRFDQLLEQLAQFPTERLENSQQRLAFYINAYNILAISMVRQHWPLTSIRKAAPWYRTVWTLDAGRIDNQLISLDTIEHQIIRPMREPRVHFAIVCASLSCPDLRPEPYNADDLERQLSDQVQRFLTNSGKGVRIDQQRVYLSKIFDWFEEDFGGEAELKSWLSQQLGRPVVEIEGYLDYHWEVNGS